MFDRRFEASVFDWDGTAVPDRSADASELRKLIEDLCANGAYVAVTSQFRSNFASGNSRKRCCPCATKPRPTWSLSRSKHPANAG
jgi:hypothetical protein